MSVPFVIEIAGGSANGKTTPARRLAKWLAEYSPCVLVQHDLCTVIDSGEHAVVIAEGLLTL